MLGSGVFRGRFLLGVFTVWVLATLPHNKSACSMSQGFCCSSVRGSGCDVAFVGDWCMNGVEEFVHCTAQYRGSGHKMLQSACGTVTCLQ
jgi:hypothetical protein